MRGEPVPGLARPKWAAYVGGGLLEAYGGSNRVPQRVRGLRHSQMIQH